MLNLIRTFLSRSSKISTGLLLATLFTAGGVTAYQHFTADCCQPGSPCCHPGSPCCHHAAQR